MTERLAVLDELDQAISTTIRGNRPNEPSFEVTDGYVKLQFAYGYHGLAGTARALDLEAAGQARLDAHREDPIHAWLIDAFAARLRGATPGELLRDRLEAFDRVTRFKVDRFREASWIIGGGDVDAVGHFGRLGRPVESVATRTETFLLRVERALAFEKAADDQGEADAFIEMSLQVGPDVLEPEAVAGVLDRVLPRISQMSDRQGLAYARAIAIAAHSAPARVPLMIERVAPYVARDAWDLDEIMAVLSGALANRPELAALWQLVPESARERPEYLTGRLRAGAMPDERDVRASASSDIAAHKLRVAMLDAFLARPFPDRFAERWAGELFGTATDDLSTNSHFSFSTVYVVDRIVCGVLAP